MKAVLFTEPNKMQFTDLPDPKAGPGDAVIEVKACGMCHTDIEVLRGNYGRSAFPVVPGHEYAGVIAELGTEVKDLRVGDRVVVDPNLECGTCRACKRGWAHLCESLGAYGVTCHGGFAERSLVKASTVHPIGDMPFDIAALAEPFGCVLNGLDAAQAKRAKNALIFGAGPMGLLLAIGLKVRGVQEITLVDIKDSSLRFAESLGFQVLAATSMELEAWHESADFVADATGVAAVAQNIMRYIANGGAGLFFGVCPSNARIEIAPFELFRRQITLAGSHSLNHNIPQSLSALQASGEDIRRLVSHRLPLEEMAEIFRGNAPQNSLKIQCVST